MLPDLHRGHSFGLKVKGITLTVAKNQVSIIPFAADCLRVSFRQGAARASPERRADTTMLEDA